MSAAHSFSTGLLVVGLLVVCGLGACWAAHSGKCGSEEDGGAIPGFGSQRVRAERSHGFERAGILRAGRGPDEEEDETPALDGVFKDVEKLEESLRDKSAA